MINLKHATLLIAVVTTALVGSSNRAQDNYCASQPPPAGLVARCQSRMFVVPDDIAAFRLALTEWMETCVASGRAAGLVQQATSVETVWRRIQDRPTGVRSVRITPKYESLKFEKDGRTCYGVKSVEFALPAGTLIEDGPDDVTPVPRDAQSGTITDEMIKESATAAIKALEHSSMTPELGRFMGVLRGLEQHGADFDDRYYPVVPLRDGSSDPPACFKPYSQGRYNCLPAAEATRACQRNLAVDIVNSHMFDRVSARRFAEILEIKASDIQRGVNYLDIAQNGESGAMHCPGLRDAIKLTVASLARKGRTVYSHY